MLSYIRLPNNANVVFVNLLIIVIILLSKQTAETEH